MLFCDTLEPCQPRLMTDSPTSNVTRSQPTVEPVGLQQTERGRSETDRRRVHALRHSPQGLGVNDAYGWESTRSWPAALTADTVMILELSSSTTLGARRFLPCQP